MDSKKETGVIVLVVAIFAAILAIYYFLVIRKPAIINGNGNGGIPDNNFIDLRLHEAQGNHWLTIEYYNQHNGQVQVNTYQPRADIDIALDGMKAEGKINNTQRELGKHMWYIIGGWP